MRTIRNVVVTLLMVFASSSFAASRTWTGTQNGNWSNPANWSPQGVPLPGESLEFAAWAQNTTNMNNDLAPYFRVGPMTFLVEAVLNGNPLTLTGDLSFVSSPSAVPTTFNVDLKLANKIVVRGAFGKQFNGAIDVNGQTFSFEPAYSTVLRGPIRGSGLIYITGTGLNIESSGPFSGTFDGRANIVGSYPNASVESARFSGNGATGNLHAGLLYPGDAPPGPSGGEHVIGVLDTGSLAIDPAGAAENAGASNSNPKGRLQLDLHPSGASDLLHVRGTVFLNAILEVTLLGNPSSGQSFLVIDNDGSDPISGTFTGLSEGASFVVGNTTLWVTYRGGDGNDVVINAGTPPPTAKTWTGATNERWSVASNWSPSGVPASGDALHFPAGGRRDMTNDLAAFIAGPMKFDDEYRLSGNELTLSGDLLFGPGVEFRCEAALRIPAPITIHAAERLRLEGAIDLGLNNNLRIETNRAEIRGPIRGTGGEILVVGQGLSVDSDGPYSGRFRGRLDLTGSYPNAVIDGLLGMTSGSGTVQAIATLRMSPGSSEPWEGASHDIGTFDTQQLNLVDEFFVDLTPTANDRIDVVGQVSLWAKLRITIEGTLAPNQEFTLIDNAGNDAVYEFFSGLPEGSVFYVGDTRFRITYKGGDGNDVVLTHLGGTVAKVATTTTLTQNRAVSEVHQPVTFTARVTAASGEVQGSVTFTDGATTLGTVALQNGQAELTIKTLSKGTHAIVATYSGNDTHEASASAPLTHTVVQGKPNLTITASASALVHGDAVSYRIDVTSSDERVPAGNVALTIDGNAAGSGALVAGTVSIDAGTLNAGSHNIAATYAGNDEFESATASLTQLVARARTALTLESNANPANLGAIVNVAVRASSTDRPALLVDGTVALRKNGQLVSEVPLSGGAGSASLGGLTAGDYEITASFAGNTFFEPATAAFTQRILADDTPVKAATTTTLTQNRAVTEVHQPVTFTARVNAASRTPTGTITFTDGATILGTVTLDNGLAELRVKTLTRGAHDIVASYSGNDTFASSASAPLVHTVVKGNPHITLSVTAATLVYGDPVTFRVDAAPSEDGVLPTGQVTLRSGNSVIGTGTLASGSASITVPLLRAGVHTITATYEGNDEFAPVNAQATATVAKAATVVSIDAGLNALAGVPVEVRVRVDAERGGLAVDGSVTVGSSDSTATSVPLTGNFAVVQIGPFEPGAFDIVASYGGSSDFEPSTATVRIDVTAPLLSVVSKKFDEGNGVHEVTVQVELTGTSTTPVTMDYRTVGGTATAAIDYDDVQGTIVFAPGQKIARIPLRILGDQVPEDDETFALELTNGVGARVNAPSATLVIQNDEPMHAAPVTHTYATEDGVPLEMTFYAPLNGNGPRPLIVWIPGDRAYDATTSELAALRLTARGYAVANIRYRKPGTTQFPAQLEDLAAAVRWLRTNAATLNVDPNRFAAWGIGAGGHLAALLGTRMNAESRVQAVVTWGAITDPSTLASDAASCSAIDWNAQTSPASLLIGCSPQLCSATAEAAAVSRYAGAGDAPMLLMHGANDCVVGARQSERLYDALRNAGVDATLRIIDGVGHDDTFWSDPAFADVQTFLDAHMTAKPRRRSVR